MTTDRRPTFTHEAPGTAETAWLAAPGWSRTRRLDVAGLERVVVVAAHPDDETLGAGGLLAAADEAGARVDVVVATDGSRSHPRSPTHTPERLAALRRAEVEHAVGLLAPTATVTHLGLPDGGLAGRVDDLAATLAPLVRAGGWLACPWRADAHPDHEAAAAACERVAGPGVRLLEYPIWAWDWAAVGALPWDAVRVLPLTPAVRERKAAAMAAHATQVAPLSPAPGDEALLRAHTLAHFARDREAFVEPRA